MIIVGGSVWWYCPYENGIDGGGHNGTFVDDDDGGGGATGGEGDEQVLSIYIKFIF